METLSGRNSVQDDNLGLAQAWLVRINGCIDADEANIDRVFAGRARATAEAQHKTYWMYPGIEASLNSEIRYAENQLRPALKEAKKPLAIDRSLVDQFAERVLLGDKETIIELAGYEEEWQALLDQEAKDLLQ